MKFSNLYDEHFRRLQQNYDRALDNHQFEQLVVYSGANKFKYLDDIPYPFQVNAQFKALVPVTDNPNCWVIWRPAVKPLLLFYRPVDFWHAVPDVPVDYWTKFFDIKILKTAEEAKELIGKGTKSAFLGEVNPLITDWDLGERNPPSLISELNWWRSYKTSYEQACIGEANRISIAGHRVARDAFYEGASEFEISQAFQVACGQSEGELAYPSIVGINEHAAILHYIARDRRRWPEQELRSLLIDAGAEYAGYASDITRTYAQRDDLFSDLVEGLNTAQQLLVGEIALGKSYLDLNISAFLSVAELLNSFGVLKTSAESALELGLIENFMPHGLGHFIGLQVHDVAGQQASPCGEIIPPHPRYPVIRMLRPIEAEQVVTVEPGVYFIESLLKTVCEGQHRNLVCWDKVHSLMPYGGIRIEDNVVVKADGVLNLTRQAFAR